MYEPQYLFYHLNSTNYQSQIKYCPGESYNTKLQNKKYTLHPLDFNFIESVDGFKTRSTRIFNGQALSALELNLLLRNVYTLNVNTPSPAPSAGGLYPLELYVIANNISEVEKGIYHYNRQGTGLTFLHDSYDLSFLPPVNTFVKDAPLIIIMTASMEKLYSKYGERAYRYALIESGHIGQNISLYSWKNNLGCCAIGGFYDDVITSLLKLENNEIPIYIYAIGKDT
ncbi:nitroreductase (plasmid) [Alkalihalophilus pseudofirmus OF4]|uniref:Nitroreductase n=1 Tax=Alkalihalophilus pseudofirmus (strain ATCC BAA-2126 / JCM 17055 / OF4) TaxID=398511 RepID=D3G1P3_ALKPO|nr:SagB/ThcOx family dehydrogenase [Alkalihalophilus pseudofirmus]ADC52269.1 nitroreductase [Alkalihalophilus pseudofirmus OF4]